jgi:hypothetical protein
MHDNDYCEFGCMPMDHGEEPDLSKGIWQDIPIEPPDYDKARAALEAMSPEEQVEAAIRYAKFKYGKNWAHMPPPSYDEIARMAMEYWRSISADPSDTGTTGIYDQMISRNTDGSDPLVPEPGP